MFMLSHQAYCDLSNVHDRVSRGYHAIRFQLQAGGIKMLLQIQFQKDSRIIYEFLVILLSCRAFLDGELCSTCKQDKPF